MGLRSHPQGCLGEGAQEGFVRGGGRTVAGQTNGGIRSRPTPFRSRSIGSSIGTPRHKAYPGWGFGLHKRLSASTRAKAIGRNARQENSLDSELHRKPPVTRLSGGRNRAVQRHDTKCFGLSWPSWYEPGRLPDTTPCIHRVDSAVLSSLVGYDSIPSHSGESRPFV